MLTKAIEHGKEHRKPYYGIKAWDKACRSGGSCKRCQADRQHKHARKLLSIQEQLLAA